MRINTQPNSVHTMNFSTTTKVYSLNGGSNLEKAIATTDLDEKLKDNTNIMNLISLISITASKNIIS